MALLFSVSFSPLLPLVGFFWYNTEESFQSLSVISLIALDSKESLKAVWHCGIPTAITPRGGSAGGVL